MVGRPAMVHDGRPKKKESFARRPRLPFLDRLGGPSYTMAGRPTMLLLGILLGILLDLLLNLLFDPD